MEYTMDGVQSVTQWFVPLSVLWTLGGTLVECKDYTIGNLLYANRCICTFNLTRGILWGILCIIVRSGIGIRRMIISIEQIIRE